tara:strand:+ start:344 stop:541 length:198 start_codon:yes stop_codon:yes gene_type:complete
VVIVGIVVGMGQDGMRLDSMWMDEIVGVDGDNEGAGHVEVGVFLGKGGARKRGERTTPIFITYFF